jgi:hypothetical protein
MLRALAQQLGAALGAPFFLTRHAIAMRDPRFTFGADAEAALTHLVLTVFRTHSPATP